MPKLPTITIYTNDGTTVLGSINLSNVGQEGYPAYINDSGISPTETAADGYIYDGSGKWFGVSTSPNTTTADYGPGTTLFVSRSSNVYAVIKNVVDIDLSTLNGYNSLANGTYSLQVKAKANGYEDSNLSASISWQKKDFIEVVPTLTRPYAANIYITDPRAPFCRISNMDTSKIYTFHIRGGARINGYFQYDTAWRYIPVIDSVLITIHNQSVNYIEIYTGTNSGYTQGLLLIAVLRGNKAATIDDFTEVQYNQLLPDYACIIEGTLITLADYTKKPIEDITYDDDLLVWNFYEGKFDSAKPVWITKPRLAPEYNLCKFSNGTEIGFVGNGGNEGYHRIYNDEAKAFTHTGVAETPVGTHTFAEDGSSSELVSQEIIKTPVRYYNIGTKDHINLFANGILTSSRISNKYTIENMKYVGDRLVSETEELEYIKRKLELC